MTYSVISTQRSQPKAWLEVPMEYWTHLCTPCLRACMMGSLNGKSNTKTRRKQMKTDIESQLKRERWLREELEFMFPKMFRDESGKSTAFDISIGPGWNDLVLDLCQDISAWHKEKNIPQPKVVEIKE